MRYKKNSNLERGHTVGDVHERAGPRAAIAKAAVLQAKIEDDGVAGSLDNE